MSPMPKSKRNNSLQLIKKWIEESENDRLFWFKWNSLAGIDRKNIDFGSFEPYKAYRKQKTSLEFGSFDESSLAGKLNSNGEVVEDIDLKQDTSGGALVKVSTTSTFQDDGSAVKKVKVQSSEQNSGSERVISNSLVHIKIKAPRPKPKSHPDWVLHRVVSGHVGWIRALAIDPENQWFASGGADRMIKIWDLASGHLKLSLTGHVAGVRGLAASKNHPFLFSVGEDKTVKCWDLEANKVIKQFYGHMSGVFSVSVFENSDLVITGGRDSSVRVWDMRSAKQVFALSGHSATVSCLVCRDSAPEILSGSMDSTIRLWDLRAGKSLQTLTHHKKSVRSIAVNPLSPHDEFCSASADALKQFTLGSESGSSAQLKHTFSTHDSIINTLSATADGVLFSGGDDGSMQFWDWDSGVCYQNQSSTAQPGSLGVENGIFCSLFDLSGSRLITGEADKTIKMWKPVKF